MRLEMPDGTAVIMVPREGGVVLATQGAKLPNGDLPQPSGLQIEGDDAMMLAALMDIVEDIEVESVIGERVVPDPR